MPLGLLRSHLAVVRQDSDRETDKGTMAQSGAATDLYSSPSTGLVHQLRQNPYVLGLASVGAPRHST